MTLSFSKLKIRFTKGIIAIAGQAQTYLRTVSQNHLTMLANDERVVVPGGGCCKDTAERSETKLQYV